MTAHAPAHVRRQQILSALMRVIARDGVAAVSVRTVAAEADLSPGALRHHFASQDSLLSAQVTAGLSATIKAPAEFDPTDPVRGLTAAIEQFLPLSPATLPPVKALYGTVVAGYAIPAVAASVQQLYSHTRTIIGGWITTLTPDGAAEPSAVDELMTLIDGLSMGLIIGNINGEAARALTQRTAAAIVQRCQSPAPAQTRDPA